MERIKANRNRIGILLMIVCAICLCMGQFIWKQSDNYIYVMVGFVIFAIGGIAMISAYRFGRLSVLQPINSISYIFSAILGAFFFGEQITIIKSLGIVIIVVGVFILAQYGDSEVEKT